MKCYKKRITKYYKWGTPNVTIVGSPTISNSVASGFSTSNYLVVPNYYQSNDATYMFKFTTGSSFLSHQVVIHWEFMLNLEIATNRNVEFFNWTSNSSTTLFTANANTTYWVKVVIVGTNKTYSYSIDGKTFINAITITDSRMNPFNTSYQFRFGLSSYNSSSPFLGSIDLKECYIEQGGYKIWTGLKKVESNMLDYNVYEDVDIYKLPIKVDRTYYKSFNMCDVAGSFTSSGWQGTDKGTNYIYGKANAYELRNNPTVTSTYTWDTPIPARTYIYNLTVTGQENGYYNNPTVTITYNNGNTEVVFGQTISTNNYNSDFSFKAKYPVKSISIQGTLTHTSVNYVWVYMTLTSKSFVSTQGDYNYYEDKTTYHAIGE